MQAAAYRSPGMPPNHFEAPPGAPGLDFETWEITNLNHPRTGAYGLV